VAFSLLFVARYAGGSTPLAIVVGLVACMLVAVTIGQLARHLPSADGFCTHNARGLGASAGFLVGWAFAPAEITVAPGGLLIPGSVVSSALHTGLGWPAWTWAPSVALAGLLIWYLPHRGIRMATAAGVVLGPFEIIVFVVRGEDDRPRRAAQQARRPSAQSASVVHRFTRHVISPAGDVFDAAAQVTPHAWSEARGVPPGFVFEDGSGRAGKVEHSVPARASFRALLWHQVRYVL